MKIESVKLKNFKAFQNVEITDIPNFCVIVGANGVGKTTFFDVFGFLKDCLTYNITKALQKRGGFKEVVSRNHERETIEIELRYRSNINKRERLVTYILEIDNEKKYPRIKREILCYRRGVQGQPFHFLNFKYGKGFAIINEESIDKTDAKVKPNRENQSLDEDILAIKGVSQFKRFIAANEFRQMIENWHVSDFHIEAARGSKDIIGGDSEHLSISGDNLQLVANEIYTKDKGKFKKILEKMKRRVPGIGDIVPESTNDGRLLLKFKDGSFKDPFIDKYVSDGTMKMFAYLVLLHDNNPHPLLCIEEPENQLYPSLMEELAEEFRDYSRRGEQVFVSTHSPDFLNALELDEVIWLIKKNGYTEIRKAKENKQIAAYMNAGDKMGYLWRSKFFDDVDPK
jgi:predicted ATPase